MVTPHIRYVSIFLLLVTSMSIDVSLAESAAFGQETGTANTKQLLIERFRANAKTDHKAAYEAAKEFFQRYPDDITEDAQLMRRWVKAYEKVELNGTTAVGRTGDSNQPAEKGSETTLEDTTKFLAHMVSRQGEVWFAAPKRLEFDGCNWEVRSVLTQFDLSDGKNEPNQESMSRRFLNCKREMDNKE